MCRFGWYQKKSKTVSNDFARFNLGRELSLPAANLKLESKLAIMEQYVGKKVIDAVIVGPKVDVSAVKERIVIQEVLEASDIPYRHDRQLLHNALEKALQALG